MKHFTRSLSFGLVACVGCAGSPAAVPETDAEGAARVFAVAQRLEKNEKTKQAMDAYHQLVRAFPNTPEARKSARRISEAQRDAVHKAATRKRK